MSLVRSKAKDWNLDEKKIGILGFSAGGHLSAMTAMHFDERAYQSIDDADKVSARPDFAILIYPAYLTNKEATELSADVKVSEKTPPMFFAHAGNDPVTPMSSVLLYGALKKAGVASELHVYSTGGHGFGLRPSDDACSTWPARCAEWLKAIEIVK
jgi:acetyl esterase/lipase